MQRCSTPLGFVAAAAALTAVAQTGLAQTVASDTCAGAPALALPLSPAHQFVRGDTASSGSTLDPMPDCDVPLAANNAFFRFTGNGNVVTISTCGEIDAEAFAQYDSAISVYCGPCDAAQCVTGSADGCSIDAGATVRFCTAPGREYIVMIHGAAAGAIGQFHAVVFDSGAPCGDPAPCRGSGEDCEAGVDFQSRSFGDAWGGLHGQAPGDVIFVEDTVPVSVENFTLGAFTGFGEARIDPANACLDDKTLRLNNICTGYDFSVFGAPIAGVTFDYLDLGGDENLQVNGGPRHEVANFAALPAVVAPGVAAADTSIAVAGGRCGTVTLTGDVQRLLIGGQELWIDNICVRFAEEPEPCGATVDAESRPLGETFNVPGPMFVENGIPCRVSDIHLGPGPFFNFAQIDPAFAVCEDGQVIETNNVVVYFDIRALYRIPESVGFEWFDQGGTENLEVNGAPRFIGAIEAAPFAIAPGVTYTNTFVDTGLGRCGQGTLTGPVSRFALGGQEFFIDNICVRFPACPCEWDGDTAQVDVFDLLTYLDAWFAAAPIADVSGDGASDVFDLLQYLDCWFTASAGNPCV
jgi:hypothetical protein